MNWKRLADDPPSAAAVRLIAECAAEAEALPVQCAANERPLWFTPEGRFRLAILAEAIANYAGVALGVKGPQFVQRNAEVWLMSNDITYAFGFMSICHVLGLEPEAVRAGAKRLRKGLTAQDRQSLAPRCFRSAA